MPGTTTDPVKKSMELPGIGPAILIDTAGIDDTGTLGNLRIQKTREVMKIIDLAILVINNNAMATFDDGLLDDFYNAGIPYLVVHGKSDIIPLDAGFRDSLIRRHRVPVVTFSRNDPSCLEELMDAIRRTMPVTAYRQRSLLADLVRQGDIVLLITPVDTEAPEGRLILPQVQVIRDILDNECVAIVLKENELDAFLRRNNVRPQLVICDTSVILKADTSVPKDIPLTGFSILLARYKGEFQNYLKGTPAIDRLKDGNSILLLESCTHHVTCDDIGRVKIPRWMDNFTGRQLQYDVVSGLNHLERPITDYSLVEQCGGCMITRKQLVNRLKPAIEAGLVTNYGSGLMQGSIRRAIRPFERYSEQEPFKAKCTG
jgi:[FeFe] hydrogenase H-cluster maturation GTPase HydF